MIAGPRKRRSGGHIGACAPLSRPIAPSADDPLEAGDELLFVAAPDTGPALEELLAPHAR
jgi:Trk K+ transport system NAD-binding subunit